MNRKPIEQVLQEHTSQWMALTGVVGTAIGLHEEQACIKVLVVERTGQLVKAIPASVEGYRVIIEATGEIRPFGTQ
jgi:multidrug efflux pump subunit AcrA (membrane-fusion protein)